MNEHKRLAERFEDQRPHLRAVANDDQAADPVQRQRSPLQQGGPARNNGEEK